MTLLLEEGSRVTWLTTVQTTSIKREQNDLMYNIAYCYVKRVKNGITYWDKQEYAVPAPNCMLKAQEKIAEIKVLNKSRN